MTHVLGFCPSCGEPIQDGYCANCGPVRGKSGQGSAPTLAELARHLRFRLGYDECGYTEPVKLLQHEALEIAEALERAASALAFDHIREGEHLHYHVTRQDGKVTVTQTPVTPEIVTLSALARAPERETLRAAIRDALANWTIQYAPKDYAPMPFQPLAWLCTDEMPPEAIGTLVNDVLVRLAASSAPSAGADDGAVEGNPASEEPGDQARPSSAAPSEASEPLPPRVDVGGGTSVRLIPERFVQVEPRPAEPSENAAGLAGEFGDWAHRNFGNCGKFADGASRELLDRVFRALRESERVAPVAPEPSR